MEYQDSLDQECTWAPSTCCLVTEYHAARGRCGVTATTDHCKRHQLLRFPAGLLSQKGYVYLSAEQVVVIRRRAFLCGCLAVRRAASLAAVKLARSGRCPAQTRWRRSSPSGSVGRR